MEKVMDKYGTSHFIFIDDVLTLNKPHITEICDLIIEQRLRVTFEGSTRANLVDDELIVKMKKAGLTRLSFGLETVDADMRETMGKKVPLKYYTQANEILDNHGVEALNSVMLGLPGGTAETIQKTLDFLRNDRHVKQANFAIAIPYPGTKFYEMAKGKVGGMSLVSESDDFSNFRRYGSAVTTVGELSQQDLLDWQNKGFVSIYSAPWRWKPMFKKHGFLGAALTLSRVFKLLLKDCLKRRKYEVSS